MAGERTLPGLGLTGFWDIGTNYKPGMDANLLRLSFSVQPYVLDSIADDPVSPVDGDIYRATGNWTSAAATTGQIAVRDNGAWVAFSPVEGWTFFDRANDQTVRYDGAAWIEWQGGAFTAADKAKLDAIVGTKFLGTYATLTALQTAHPTPAEGSYGHVDPGPGQDVLVYVWDNDDSAYVQSQGSLTGAEIVALIDAELGGTTWQSGGGGGGGSASGDKLGFARWTPPPATGWAVFAGGGAYLEAGYDATLERVRLRKAGNTSQNALLLSGNIPAGTDFVRVMTLVINHPAQNFAVSGVIVQNSATGASVRVGRFGASTVYRQYYNGNTFVSEAAVPSAIATDAARNGKSYFRIRRTSNVLYFDYSDDGIEWVDTGMAEDIILGQLGGDADEIGIFQQTVNISAGIQSSVTLIGYDTAQQPEARAGGLGPMTLVDDTASRDITAADFTGNKIVKANSGAAMTLTVPSGLVSDAPLTIVQTGAGQVDVAAGVGVTLHSADGNLKLRTQYSSATLIPEAADTYLLVGDLTA